MQIQGINSNNYQNQPNFKALVISKKIVQEIPTAIELLYPPYEKVPYRIINIIDGRYEVFVVMTRQGSIAEKEFNKTYFEGKAKSVSSSKVRYYKKITNLWSERNIFGNMDKKIKTRLEKAQQVIPPNLYGSIPTTKH